MASALPAATVAPAAQPSAASPQETAAHAPEPPVAAAPETPTQVAEAATAQPVAAAPRLPVAEVPARPAPIAQVAEPEEEDAISDAIAAMSFDQDEEADEAQDLTAAAEAFHEDDDAEFYEDEEIEAETAYDAEAEDQDDDAWTEEDEAEDDALAQAEDDMYGDDDADDMEDEDDTSAESFFATSVDAAPEEMADDVAVHRAPAAGTARDDDEDGILSKLRRIRAVVSRTKPDAAPSIDAAFDAAEDDHAAPVATQDRIGLDELHEAVTGSDRNTDTIIAEAMVDEDEWSESEDWDDLAEAADASDEVSAEAEADAYDEADDWDETWADDAPAEDAAEIEVGEIEAGEIIAGEAAFEERVDGDTSIATGWARVVKVKRRDLEAALHDDEEDAAADMNRPTTLSAADEAELQSELAELEAELADRTTDAEDPMDAEDVAEDDHDDWDMDDDDSLADEDSLFDEDDSADEEEDDEMEAVSDAAPAIVDPEPAAEAPAAAQSAPAGRAKFDASAQDMDRILAETNHQLDETEGSRRRNAIAHLRAAVAATKAEKQAGSELTDSDRDSTDAYRQDLAQVVRPRRPRASGTPLRRTEDKPAPLRLVAEQRVDIEMEHRDPIRPRRVSIADMIRTEAEAEHAADMPAKGKGESFAAYLETTDAEDLGEILEAAASFLAFVEGREQFSRPQLMSRVREVKAEEYSREDALRAFGTLLREGKIRKVKGGRFNVSDRIGFRPDRRAAG